jgi:hypothetical protein
MAPCLLGIALVGLIIRIGRHLLALPSSFPRLLAGLFGAESLGLDTGIRDKAAPAVGTSTLAVHSSSWTSRRFSQGACPGRIRMITKRERKERQMKGIRQEGKKNQRTDDSGVSLVYIFIGDIGPFFGR